MFIFFLENHPDYEQTLRDLEEIARLHEESNQYWQRFEPPWSPGRHTVNWNPQQNAIARTVTNNADGYANPQNAVSSNAAVSNANVEHQANVQPELVQSAMQMTEMNPTFEDISP